VAAGRVDQHHPVGVQHVAAEQHGHPPAGVEGNIDHSLAADLDLDQPWPTGL
jgi:hypothetical protein